MSGPTPRFTGRQFSLSVEELARLVESGGDAAKAKQQIAPKSGVCKLSQEDRINLLRKNLTAIGRADSSVAMIGIYDISHHIAFGPGEAKSAVSALMNSLNEGELAAFMQVLLCGASMGSAIIAEEVAGK